MKILYIDAFSGLSGDKLVSALYDALDQPVDLDDLFTGLQLTTKFSTDFEEVSVNGIESKRFLVNLHTDKEHHHRNFTDVCTIINGSRLSEKAKQNAVAVFRVLAESEGRIHNQPFEKVHFHEVGAIDSIVDICYICHLLDIHKIDKIFCSPVATGSGFVETQHGTLPVPAPATYDLLRGIPVKSSGIESELTTPTGASVIKALCTDFGEIPDMMISSIGYGAGTKTFSIPNVTRVAIGLLTKISDQNDVVMQIETNIDDTTPEYIAFVCEKLFSLHALDVWTTPIIMKKGRLATMLSILCHICDAGIIESFIFANTSTLGIRKSQRERTILQRENLSFNIDGNVVLIKCAYRNGSMIHCKPEFESIKIISELMNVTLKQAETIILQQLNSKTD